MHDPATVRLETPAVLPGARVVAERYRLIHRLADGGFGSVWRAEDTRLDNRAVAVKFLTLANLDDTEAKRDLRREAHVLLSLSHPNLVRLHTFDCEGDQPFLVMELIEGPTLAQVLAARGRLTASEVAEFGRQICAGLAHAHAEGVIHLDLKPSNVMLTGRLRSLRDPGKDPTARIKITDFGIACPRREAQDPHARSGRAATLTYASPELLRGEPVDERSDLYSLGCVLHALLTGEPPSPAGDRALRPAPPGCPPSLWAAITRCLAADPRRRVASATELQDLLSRVSRPSRRRWLLPAAALAVALALVGAVALRPRPEAETPAPSAAPQIPVAMLSPPPTPAGMTWKKSPGAPPKFTPPLPVVAPGLASPEEPLLALPPAASPEGVAAAAIEADASEGEVESPPRRRAPMSEETRERPPRRSTPPQAEPPRREQRSQAREAFSAFRHRIRNTFDEAERALDRFRENH